MSKLIHQNFNHYSSKKIIYVYAASHKEVKRNLAGTGVLNHAGSDSFRDSLPIFKGMRICPT